MSDWTIDKHDNQEGQDRNKVEFNVNNPLLSWRYIFELTRLLHVEATLQDVSTFQSSLP